jgi:hypothetical protein
MIMEDKAFLRSYDTAPRPPPPPPLSPVRNLSLFLSLPVCHQSREGVGGGGGCQIIRPPESLVLYKSFNTLWLEPVLDGEATSRNIHVPCSYVHSKCHIFGCRRNSLFGSLVLWIWSLQIRIEEKSSPPRSSFFVKASKESLNDKVKAYIKKSPKLYSIPFHEISSTLTLQLCCIGRNIKLHREQK